MLKEMIERYRKRRAIRVIKETWILFGADPDTIKNLTDEEVQKIVLEQTRLIGECGVTMAQAAAGLRELGLAMERAGQVECW